MRLAHLTWTDIAALSTDTPVLIPTGAVEQHGAHMPLATDTILVTAVAEAVEARLTDRVILTPTVWLGASLHHLPFPGTLSASFDAYHLALNNIIVSLADHGFHRFMVVNGHGGNADSNRIVLRELKHQRPELTLAYQGYYDLWPAELCAEVMEGPDRQIQHACEAETSLMLHVQPDLVKMDRARDDGLRPESGFAGGIWAFNEITEAGSLGYATLATAEKGKRLFEAAVEGVTQWVESCANGVTLKGIVGSGTI
ncbi:MAG: creatininase family protein [Fimbriimonadaceae bacterium]|nr:creatininase family protein [Fimbriimonadaceae bacterium]